MVFPTSNCSRLSQRFVPETFLQWKSDPEALWFASGHNSKFSHHRVDAFSMIRHISLLKFVEGKATLEAKKTIESALSTLPSIIPQIRAYTFGSDLKLAEGNADFAVVADFDNEDAYRVYAEHPEHKKILAETIKPLLDSRVALQYRLR